MTLKELRMYHWKQAMASRDLQSLAEKSGLHDADYHMRTAHFHISACQALNNVLDGCAEYDINELEEKWSKN